MRLLFLDIGGFVCVLDTESLKMSGMNFQHSLFIFRSTCCNIEHTPGVEVRYLSRNRVQKESFPISARRLDVQDES